MTTWSTTWTWRSSVRSYPPREQQDMKRIAKISLAAAVLGALVVLIVVSGCGAGDDDAVIVTLTPSSIDAEPGGSFTVNVDVDPKGQGISAAEVTINFDTQVFAYEGMSAGELLGASPLVGVESADQEIGQLIFALARRGATSAPTESGTLATLTFRVLDDASAGEHGLTVYWVGLADEAQQNVPLIASSPAIVNL